MFRILRCCTAAVFIFLLSSCSRPSSSVQKKNHISSFSLSGFSSYTGSVVFRLAEQAPENHPSAIASKYFADLVNEQTQGNIQIKVYYSGKLGNTQEVFDQLKFGGIALGRVSFAELTETVPSLQSNAKQVIRGPYNCRKWIMENREKLLFDCQTEKIYPLAVFYPEMRCFYADSPKYQLRTLNDLANTRIGIIPSKLLQDVLKQYKAVPVDIVSEDTYFSMHNGYMNVRESELSDFILSNDYGFIQYVTLSTYISSPGMIIMSSDAANDISVEQRKIMIDCAQRAAEYQRSVLENFYAAHIPLMRKTKTVLQGAL